MNPASTWFHRKAIFGLLTVALVTAIFLLWPRSPALVRELRSLPVVANVEWSGTASNWLTVVHIRDWHFVPKELLDLEGIDHEEHLADVEKVQADQLDIIRHLTRFRGVRSIYLEGLSDESAPDLQLRIMLLRDLADDEPDETGKALQLLLRSEVGVPGQLLERGEVDEVLPLEDEAALQDARPVKDGKIVPDAEKIDVRRRAMVKQLPAQGLVVLVLGGSHDLGAYLPEGTAYVQVTPRSYPGE